MIAVMTGVVPAAAVPFDEVYREHANAVFRFCVSQLRDHSVAEDVAGDVFAAAFAAYERTQPEPDGVRTWLFRIARNAVIDQYRREGRSRSLLSRLGRSAHARSTVEESVEQRTDLRSIRAAIDTLGDRDRQLVGLRIAGGLSYADLAAVLNMREGAARMATHRALARVRARLAEET